jgi:hypothetical protein
MQLGRGFQIYANGNYGFVYHLNFPHRRIFMDNSIDNDAIHTLKERDELGNDSIYKAAQLVQKWNNRLTVNNLRLAKRYLEGDLELHLVFRLADVPDPSEYCAILKYWAPHAGESGSDELHRRNYSLQSQVRVNLEHDFLLPKCGTEEHPVFVDIVKLVECPESIVTTLVRLESVYETYRARAHSLYLSRRLGFIFGRTLADGKISFSSGCGPVGLDQLKRQIVKNASQVLDGFSSDQRNVGWYLRANIDLLDFVSHLRIILGPDSIRISFQEGMQPLFKIADVLFGPFDFRPDAR